VEPFSQITHQKIPRITATMQSSATRAAMQFPAATEFTVSSPMIPYSDEVRFVVDDDMKTQLSQKFAKLML
jgi:hypothetical protein